MLDPDAEAFLTATGITDETITSAIDGLVVDLKAAGIWTKMNAIYPYVGGTATTHKYNLKDPQDLDSAFRIGWVGTITHNSNGVTGDGTTGYGTTWLNASSELGGGLNDVSGFTYSRTNALDDVDFGAYDGNGFQINPRNPSGQLANRCNTATLNTPANSNSAALIGISRLGSASYNLNINKSHSTVANASTSAPNRDIFLLALNNAGTAAAHSARNIALQCFGYGLTTGEIDNLVDANEAFQTTLGRFV